MAEDAKLYTADSVYQQWLDIKAKQAYPEFLSFDDKTLPKYGPFLRWCTLVPVSAICAVVSALPYLIGFFPPAGYKGSTVQENVACTLLWCVGAIFLAHLFAFYSPLLSDTTWFTFWAGNMVFICVVVRNLVEQLSGAKPDLMLAYLLFNMTVYPLLNPLPAAIGRLAGDPDWKKMSLTAVKRAFSKEFQGCSNYLNGVLSGAIFFLLYFLVDVAVFVSPLLGKRNEMVTLVCRPLCALVVKRVMSFILYTFSAQSNCPEARWYTLFTMYLVQASVSVRLATASADEAQLVTNVAFDWAMWLNRTYVLWVVTSPATRRVAPCPESAEGGQAEPEEQPTQKFLETQGYGRLTKAYVWFWTFDKIPPLPGMEKGEYRAAEYMLEGIALSTFYLATFLAYGFYTFGGLGPGSPAYDLHFPFGEQSIRFAAFAFATDLVQDFLGHQIAERWVSRKKHCAFTRIAPGWLLHRHTTVQVVKAALAPYNGVAFITQLAFYMRQQEWI